MSLALQSCRTPLARRGELKVFRDWETACRHLCDHVLSMPEAEAWAELLGPDAAQILASNKRFRLAKRMWSPGDEGESAQPLYNEYAKAIRAALETGARVGWVWRAPDDRRVRKTLGLTGVLVVFDAEAVRSGMLPGFGNPHLISQSKEQDESVESRRRNPLPREGGEEEDPPLRPTALGMRPRRRDVSTRRSASSESPELRRFKIFRKCAQHVRSEFFRAYFHTKGAADAPEELRRSIKEFGSWLQLADPGDKK